MRLERGFGEKKGFEEGLLRRRKSFERGTVQKQEKKGFDRGFIDKKRRRKWCFHGTRPSLIRPDLEKAVSELSQVCCVNSDLVIF